MVVIEGFVTSLNFGNRVQNSTTLRMPSAEHDNVSTPPFHVPVKGFTTGWSVKFSTDVPALLMLRSPSWIASRREERGSVARIGDGDALARLIAVPNEATQRGVLESR